MVGGLGNNAANVLILRDNADLMILLLMIQKMVLDI